MLVSSRPSEKEGMGVDDARIPRGVEVQGSQFEAYALLRAQLVSGSWYVSSRMPLAVCLL